MELEEYLEERISVLSKKIEEYEAMAKEPQAGGPYYWEMQIRDIRIRKSEIGKLQYFLSNK